MKQTLYLQQIIAKAGPKDPKPLFQLSPKQVENLKTVSEVVLGVILTAGAITLSAVAPNLFSALDKMSWVGDTFTKKSSKHKEQGRKIGKSLSYLKTSGFINIKPSGNDFVVEISQKGREKILRFNFSHLTVHKPRNWDGKWWLVMADIPTKHKDFADYFRVKLRKMGFYALQKSVWIYPFDPRDEINFVSAYYLVDPYVTTMQIGILEPEDEKKLQVHFKKIGAL